MWIKDASEKSWSRPARVLGPSEHPVDLYQRTFSCPISSLRVSLLLPYSPQASLQTSPPLHSYLLFIAALLSPDLHPSPYRPSSSYFCYCVLGTCVRSSVCELSTTRAIRLCAASLFAYCRRHLAVICFVMLPVIHRVLLLLDDSFDSAYHGRYDSTCNVSAVCENDLIRLFDEVLLTRLLHSLVHFLNTFARTNCSCM